MRSNQYKNINMKNLDKILVNTFRQKCKSKYLNKHIYRPKLIYFNTIGYN